VNDKNESKTSLDAGWSALIEQGRAMIDAEREFRDSVNTCCLDCGMSPRVPPSMRCEPCAQQYGEKW